MSETTITKTTLTELIENSPKLGKLKHKLSKFKKGSNEYFAALFSDLVLSKSSDFKAYLKQQSVPLPGTDHVKGYSAIYRNSLSPEKLVSAIDSSLDTGYKMFSRAVEIYGDNDCLGERVYDQVTGKWSDYYVWESYRQVQQRSRNLGAGIISLVNTSRGRPLDTADFIVSIMSTNRKEWILTDLACQTFGLANTALYTTLGEETSEYILNLTESPVLVLQSSNLLKVLSYLPNLKHVTTLISMDELSDAELKNLNENFLNGVKLFNMTQVESIGSLLKVDPIPPTPESLYTISFTSGTTGMPKGVELSHEHLASAVSFAKTNFDLSTAEMSKSKQHYELCFLPLAHIFQRQITSISLSSGFGCGFMHIPDPSCLTECLRILKPTFLAVVPRILTKMESGIKNSLNNDEVSVITKNIAHNILDAKLSRFQSRGGPDDSFINSLLYHKVLIDKIRTQLGFDNLEFMVIGSAPVSNETLMFMRSCLDVGIKQGYGLTETFAGLCISETYERDVGSCGGPGVSCEIRLKSVPSMGYDAEKELKGEIQTRGPQSVVRYYKNPDATKSAIDKSGWFSTGDIGYIDNKGRLHIIDRVKNFFKLAQGEYIAPEKIENSYLSNCPEITQIFIHGNSLETFLVAIVGVDPGALLETLTKYYGVKAKGLSPEEMVNKINSDTSLRVKVLVLLNRHVPKLQGFEKIHNLHLGIEPLKIDDGNITPSFKVKRNSCAKFFKEEITNMYKEGSLIRSNKL
ncbi:unnamed protein product [Kluyveromyces dobzhanskii CBS 2104]|uniref:WGS project CCBQ000000000 data, contig 00012 n=1 Tax=Kluyveromyces dobzhanskii CBS 2104 TaxID=1427455 RepID=A0A0A8L326_9SACH|nr:unnamed protein product [Kluyveromyces dobzhanskii CBS 2104]